jgi:hypothetical protein
MDPAEIVDRVTILRAVEIARARPRSFRLRALVGYQGVELVESGRLTLPMPEPERSTVMAPPPSRPGGGAACGCGATWQTHRSQKPVDEGSNPSARTSFHLPP